MKNYLNIFCRFSAYILDSDSICYPRWVELLSAFLMLLGLGLTLFGIIEAIIFLSKSIGIV